MQDVEQEAPYEIPSQKPPPSSPAEGRLEFKDVSLSYRPVFTQWGLNECECWRRDWYHWEGWKEFHNDQFSHFTPLSWLKFVFLILLPALLNSTQAQSP